MIHRLDDTGMNMFASMFFMTSGADYLLRCNNEC
jgi:hypothetical protein